MGCDTDLESKLIRVRKTTYDKLDNLKEPTESFNDVINKMHLIYINRIVTESELRYTIKKELTEILLRYLEKEN